jgi:hypothetical protein
MVWHMRWPTRVEQNTFRRLGLTWHGLQSTKNYCTSWCSLKVHGLHLEVKAISNCEITEQLPGTWWRRQVAPSTLGV